MTDELSSDVVHIAAASSRPQTVFDRILRRKAVLTQWLREGIPAGKLSTVPSSLREARDWEDAELGIIRIGSPNEFTQGHPDHGQHVRAIAGLLTDLKKKYARPEKARRPAAAPVDDGRKDLQSALTAAVSQWHASRASELAERDRANGAEARSTLLLQENAEKDDEIADLRRRLANREGLRVVE